QSLPFGLHASEVVPVYRIDLREVGIEICEVLLKGECGERAPSELSRTASLDDSLPQLILISTGNTLEEGSLQKLLARNERFIINPEVKLRAYLANCPIFASDFAVKVYLVRVVVFAREE
ncbi:MAG: hypothetical protein AB1631_33105, partial [Acidobacteriota bacterium]